MSFWPLIRLLPQKTNFQFVKFAVVAAFLSISLVIGSFVSMATLGFNLGIDFRGGTLIEVAHDEPINLGQVRAKLSALDIGDVTVQDYGKPTSALVRFEAAEGGKGDALIARVKSTLSQAYPGMSFPRTEVVGAKVSGELFRSGIAALALAIGLMLIYIWFRFELQFGIGSVVALFHDVILTLGLLSVLQIEFSLTTIAALLTIIGYSMNDTVVVFDRLRENMRRFKKMKMREIIDLSINETLSRTIITGVTALMALIGLLYFGGPTLFPFVFAMIFGIVIGTYSSIYVASPVLLLRRDTRRTGESDVAAQSAG